jgi:2-C-methyl-D-erythritol 4-phosphate cytidylyltransferase
MWTQESLHFIHSLKTFCQLKEVKEVVVVCDPDYRDVFEGCKIVHTHSIFLGLATHLSEVVKKSSSTSTGSIETLQIPLKFACPGKERQDSVFNGLQVSDDPHVYCFLCLNIIGILCIVCSQETDGDSELVCVHDSARPLVSSEDVKKVSLIVHDPPLVTS